MPRAATTPIPPLPAEGYVRLPQILRVLPIGRSSWWVGVRTGRYPKPVKLGLRVTVWRVEDIRRLLADLGAEPTGADVASTSSAA